MVKFKFVIILVILLFSKISLNAQESIDKWGFGLNVASVFYSDAAATVVGGSYIATVPGFCWGLVETRMQRRPEQAKTYNPILIVAQATKQSDKQIIGQVSQSMHTSDKTFIGEVACMTTHIR